MSGIPLKDFVLELGRTDVKIVIEAAKEIGITLKANSSLDEETAAKLYDFIKNKRNVRAPKIASPAPQKPQTPKTQSAPKEEDTPPPQVAPVKRSAHRKRSIEIVSTGTTPPPAPKPVSPPPAPSLTPKVEDIKTLSLITILRCRRNPFCSHPCAPGAL
ncbi:hypothetical protein [Helicobacter felis]|uniref:hypothetical protein n=1 Tax=Helicobacter felis TaxID=214 RepID=UPI001F3AE8F4|nr:hypothetical protein [Helicobacter felis]